MKLDLPNAWARVLFQLVVLVSALGWAQEKREPNGIKVGEGRLHPFLTTELHYDSAAGFFGSNNTLHGELIAHYQPGLRYQMPGSDFFIDLDGKLDYEHYTGWLSSGSTNASRLQAFADLSTAFNRNGSVELDVSDHFTRSDHTSNPATGVGVISLFNEARALAPIHPGGHALEVTPGVAYSVELFQAISSLAPTNCTQAFCDPNQVSSMNYQNVRPSLEANWKFLPKTALILDTRLDIRSYLNSGTNPSAQLLMVSAGLSGLISQKVATVVKAGYSQDFSTSQVKTLIGQVELQYLMSETANIRVGGTRLTQPVPVYGTYADNRAYLEARMLLGGRLTLRGSGMYDHLTFYSGFNRTDDLFTLKLAPEYQFASWLVGAIGYTLTSRSSNNAAVTINYTRHDAFLAITLTY